MMSERLDIRLKAFTYHRPSPAVAAVMATLRTEYMRLVQYVDGAMPECREKSLAFTALEESAMWAMKALALTDPQGEVISP